MKKRKNLKSPELGMSGLLFMKCLLEKKMGREGVGPSRPCGQEVFSASIWAPLACFCAKVNEAESKPLGLTKSNIFYKCQECVIGCIVR
jgi:hypothetical protein